MPKPRPTENAEGVPSGKGRSAVDAASAQDALPAGTDSANVSLSRVAYDEVLGQILNGTLRSKDIVHEGRIAAELGVSRTPMREAIGKLEGEGFLVRSGRALQVRELTLADYLEIVHMRRTLECEAIGIAVEAVGQGDFSEALLRTLRDEVDGLPLDASHEAYWSLDTRLHGAIVDAAGSKLLSDYVRSLRQRTLLFWNDRPRSRLEVGRSEHLAIIDALLARDKPAAVAAMRQHLDNIRNDALRSLWRFG